MPFFVSSVAVGVAPQYASGLGSANLGLPPYEEGKGWISGDPHVTMRLETPVIYFYPPKGQPASSVLPLNVHVDFHGGVLSQFYPHADFAGLPKLRYPGLPQDNIFPYVDKAMGINAGTLTSLDWKGVQLGSTKPPIECDDKVWTTPRETAASVLQVKFSELDGNPAVMKEFTEAEHFLFYRGVGHLGSPLRIDTTLRSLSGTAEGASQNDNSTLQVRTESGSEDLAAFSECWLANIRSDGTCAFCNRDLSEKDVPAKARFVAGWFGLGPNFTLRQDQFSSDNLLKLKASMHDALVKEGLYDDEATAMLKTWDLSYFKSPGLRFFYIVPRTWVDNVLPLKITGPKTDITRVMVGRIELVTDAQKAALARLSMGPCPDLPALKKAALDAIGKGKLSRDESQAYFSGEKPLSDLGLAIPPLVQDYLSLGRFRDALIVHEQQQHPSAALAQFIKDNQLAGAPH